MSLSERTGRNTNWIDYKMNKFNFLNLNLNSMIATTPSWSPVNLNSMIVTTLTWSPPVNLNSLYDCYNSYLITTSEYNVMLNICNMRKIKYDVIE